MEFTGAEAQEAGGLVESLLPAAARWPVSRADKGIVSVLKFELQVTIETPALGYYSTSW